MKAAEVDAGFLVLKSQLCLLYIDRAPVVEVLVNRLYECMGQGWLWVEIAGPHGKDTHDCSLFIS